MVLEALNLNIRTIVALAYNGSSVAEVGDLLAEKPIKSTHVEQR